VSKHTAEEIQKILTEWQSGFDLEKGNLFQVGYLHGYADGSSRIYFALHHLIVDGVSWRILTEDIKALYDGKTLPAKGSSYRQWVERMKQYSIQHSAEAGYWEGQLKGLPEHKTDSSQEMNYEAFELNRSLTSSLLQEASKAYHTEVNDLLLTGLAYALKEINHQDVQGITLEGHGREDIDVSIDHSRTVGWFTSMFPVRLELKSTLKESIQFIKEGLRRIPNKGIGFGAFATTDSSLSYSSLPRISFNYLGQFEAKQGAWQIVQEQSGYTVGASNKDINIININGLVSDGKLEFTIASKLGVDVTKMLSDNLKSQLIKIIEHCTEKIGKEGSSNTPSDFKSVKISQSLLDKLQLKAKSI
jgi:non-ribosomal peptide synthase protein (TIGR01720 family)